MFVCTLHVVHRTWHIRTRTWSFFAQLHNMMSMCTDVEKNAAYTSSGVRHVYGCARRSRCPHQLYVCPWKERIQVAKDRFTLSAQQLLTVGGVPRSPWRAGVMAWEKEMSAYEYTSVVTTVEPGIGPPTYTPYTIWYFHSTSSCFLRRNVLYIEPLT